MAGLTDPKTPRSVVFGASLLVEGNGALLMAGSGKEKKGKGDKEKNEEVEMGEQVEGKTGKVITAELHPFVFGALLKGISQLWHGDFL